ncbi:hypothetical protein ACTFIY_008396 [Dictyostelium cf. discoideum]
MIRYKTKEIKSKNHEDQESEEDEEVELIQGKSKISLENLKDKFLSLIGITYEDFNDYICNLKELIDKNNNGERRGRKNCKNSQKDFLLQWPVLMEVLLNIDTRTLNRYVDEYVLYAKKLAINNFQSVFDKRKDKSNSCDYYDGVKHYTVTMVADGSEQQITIPTNEKLRNMSYRGKKCKSTLTLLVYCCPSSVKILHIGYPIGGYENVDSVFGDKGFRGLTKYFKNIFTIPSGQRTEYQKQKDNNQKSIRIIIENFWQKIKQFYMASLPLRYKFKSETIDMDRVLEGHHFDQNFSKFKC